MIVSVLITIVFAIVTIAPLFVRCTAYNPSAACIRNLELIEQAKRLWGEDFNKNTNDVPTWDDIRLYFPKEGNGRSWSNGLPICPSGGTYMIGRLDDPPKCSIGRYHSIR
jgi:hypothetical protein